MDKIVFYIGDETGYVVENKDLKNSLFREQYTAALKLFKSIYRLQPTSNVSNVIAFCGDRGEGKTSCMRSFMELLKNNEKLHGFEPELPFGSNDIEILDVIDPAFFDQTHNLLELFLGQMYGKITDKILKEEYSENYSQRQELLKYFQKAKMHLSHLEKEKRELYDPLEELGALSAGIKLKDCLGRLVEEYLSFLGKKKLVIAIDDLDLNMTEGYQMAEQIRKYLNLHSCILLIGLKVGQLTMVIKNSMANDLDKRDQEVNDELPAMASKYVVKLIPYGNRVLMPSINELCNVKLQICRHGDALKESNDLNSVKDEVTRLIFKKTRYLFYNEKGSVSPIVPQNLRSLRLLLGMLLQMEDFVDNKSHAGNKRIFKAYFFDEWTKCLKPDDQTFVKGLLDYHDLSGINMYVLTHLQQIDLKKSKMSEYDVSLGQVLKTLTDVNNSNTDGEFKKLIFFLRSFYSMKLYELYDAISETENGIYPSISAEEKEIVKVDTVFKNVNQLQKLLNGAYFSYAQNDFLAPRKDNSPRDLHAINGSKLNDILRKVAVNLDKYKDVTYGDDNETEEANEWREFKQNFRLCEFFMLTTLRDLTSKDKGNVQTYFKSPNPSVPAYMTEYNINMGYYLFDVMAPFYNLVNVKYAYRKFADIGDIYDYALEHDWSLLRSMVKAAYENRGINHPEGSEMDKDFAMHCLVSDSIIRNVDVHSAIVETMLTYRQKNKDTGITTGLLERTYDALTKIGMKTYFFSEGKAHEIRFAFLNALIDFLGERNDEVFDEIFYAASKDVSNNQGELSADDSDWLDSHFPKIQENFIPKKGKTVIMRLYDDVKGDFKEKIKSGIFQKGIDNDKRYNTWDEVKQALAPIVKELKEAASQTAPPEVTPTGN